MDVLPNFRLIGMMFPPVLLFRLFVLLVFFIGFGHSPASSQGLFFQTSTQTKSGLTSTQISRYEKSELSDMTEAIWFIQINDFAQQVSDQVLELQVPGDTMTYSYHARYVWSPSTDDITWYGDTDSSGYASFQLKDNELSGYFNIEDRDYFIRPLGNDDYILVKLAEEEDAICGYNSPDNPKEEIQQYEPQHASDRGENCDVKVLVLYTSNAAEGIDNIHTFISGLISQSNQALRNSGIANSELTFVLAGKALLSDFTESSDINADLLILRTNPTAILLRNSLFADCVMLLTDGKYRVNGSAIYGLAPSCGPGDALSFSIVEAVAAASRMSFVHELAHLFGCKHSPGNKNGGCEPAFERPHWFRCGGRDRYTIMESGVKKKNRIPHFSNPEVLYHGHPTGTHANSSGSVERDNARQLREQACIIGEFRTSYDLRAIIYGDDHWCVSSLGIPIPLVAQASGGGPGPYTYLWQISNNGIIYNPMPLSTTANAIVPMPTTLEAGDMVFIRLVVVSGTGQMYVTYWEIRVLPMESPDCDGGEERPARLVTPDKNFLLFSISPNPADNFVSIVFPDTWPPDDFSVEIFSVLGHLFAQQTFALSKENRTDFNLDISHLPDGNYFIRVKSKNRYETSKLIIIH